jgi:hypothetical protein
MSTPRELVDLRLDGTSLYREEVFSDRHVGSIRRLVPVRPDGSDDTSRKILFEGQTTLLTPGGPLPLRFEIDADTLSDALERFGAAAEVALEETLKELEELRRRSTSPLIVPGQAGLGLGDLRGPGPGSGRIGRP